MSREPRAVIFDLDGVIADSEGLHIRAWEQVLADRGLPVEERWRREWVGVADPTIAEQVDRHFGTAVGADRLVSDKQRRFRELVVAHLRPFDGVAVELERCLAAGFPMAIGTSSARVDASLMLRVTGFDRFFPVVVAGDDVPQVKPAPDIYLEASRLLGVAPGRCMVLEDSPGGITAARKAGMAVAAVATSFPAEGLGAAEWVFDTTAEAIRWLHSTVTRVGTLESGPRRTR